MEAFDIFNKLQSKSAKLQFVKEQILIRYLGLGWTKAYHPWSKNKHIFSPSELMEHFVKVVLPLDNTEVVPTAPPMNLPGLPSLPTLGTVAHDLWACYGAICNRAEEQGTCCEVCWIVS
jgi:hypothetical protein